MNPPLGLLPPRDNRVYKLNKSIYSLKQAFRNWFDTLDSALKKRGFSQSKADNTLFTLHKSVHSLIVLAYVDDLVLVGDDLNDIESLKKYLGNCFPIKDLGALHYFLGVEVIRTLEFIFLNQRKYLKGILEDTNMMDCRLSSFPMEQHHHLQPNTSPPIKDPTQYQRLVGRLLYLTITKPEISYSVNTLSQFMSDPRQAHLDAGMHILRYLRSSLDHGILLSSYSDFTIIAYCDSDWA
ncbi:PREDICTED: uncharacterized protein LOC109114514 [Nelumbo nucifera]|uniref:Uncharacterized protein LOC109114514 n=1 Tax=Nelumbo nucifera TaxID=4432 RepID=A0A1U8Q1V9_NELNU|nr:PREDICTED: uncharacterized protein LOC109114514 [Nelumbo nucifera]